MRYFFQSSFQSVSGQIQHKIEMRIYIGNKEESNKTEEIKQKKVTS